MLSVVAARASGGETSVMDPRPVIGVGQPRGDLRRQPAQISDLAQHPYPGVRHDTLARPPTLSPAQPLRYCSPRKCLSARNHGTLKKSHSSLQDRHFRQLNTMSRGLSTKNRG